MLTMILLILAPLAAAAAAEATPQEQLFAAIRGARAEEVKRLLDESPTLAAARNAKGLSAVTAALFLQSGETFVPPAKNTVLAEVLRHGPSVDRFEAAAVGDVQRVSKEVAADPGYLAAENSFGWAPIHFAAFAGNLDVAKLLLDRGAAINQRANTKFLNTPLQVALLTGQEQMAELLVARGADVRIEQAEGFTALHEAAQIGSERVVKLLLDAGADPSARAKDGRTPLTIARTGHYQSIARLLESRGARG